MKNIQNKKLILFCYKNIFRIFNFYLIFENYGVVKNYLYLDTCFVSTSFLKRITKNPTIIVLRCVYIITLEPEHERMLANEYERAFARYSATTIYIVRSFYMILKITKLLKINRILCCDRR